jgi:hypothetical protein
MKALKTIVATAVIVFALTTVAMAGVRHVGSWGDAVTPAAGPATTQTHRAAGVTLTDVQFARLLRAVSGNRVMLHTTQADRETARERTRDQQDQAAGDAAIQAQAQQRTQTHGGGGTHDGGTQGGTAHHGETHHDGGTHDGGTHHE